MKTLFVDLDGTLVDSHAVLFEIYLKFLEKHGITGSKSEFEELIGPSITEIAILLRQRYHLKDSVEELYAEYQNLIKEYYFANLQVYPKALETLVYAKSLGWQLVMVTSAEKKLVDKLLTEKKHFENLFDFIVTTEGIPKGKPDPAIYLLALQIANASAQKSLAIEDSPQGVESALNAGLRVCWIKHHQGGSQFRSLSSRCTEVDDWEAVRQFLASLF